jgi:hypothetical protein
MRSWFRRPLLKSTQSTTRRAKIPGVFATEQTPTRRDDLI